MSLERDLQQKAFKSEYQKALLNIIYTHNSLLSGMNDFFKDYEITRQQYNVLRILRGQSPKPATVQLIRERMLDKMSDASRIVERLRLKNLIERTNNERDKRSVHVTITDAGLKLLDTIEPEIEVLEKSLRKLSPEEVTRLNELLDKVTSNDTVEPG